jgi:hypothetical protein
VVNLEADQCSFDNWQGAAVIEPGEPVGQPQVHPVQAVATASPYREVRVLVVACGAGEPPPAGALTLEPALDWVEAALPQQNREVLAGLTGPVAVVISGPGARSIRLGPPGEPVASMGSGAASFLRWVTQRATLEEAGAEVSGDGRQLAVARKLRVF